MSHFVLSLYKRALTQYSYLIDFCGGGYFHEVRYRDQSARLVRRILNIETPLYFRFQTATLYRRRASHLASSHSPPKGHNALPVLGVFSKEPLGNEVLHTKSLDEFVNPVNLAILSDSWRGGVKWRVEKHLATVPDLTHC